MPFFRSLFEKLSEPEPEQVSIDEINARIARERADRPQMPPITNGVMSVAIRQKDGFVEVFIELSETTKHILSKPEVLATPVDELHLDFSAELRHATRIIDDLGDNFSQREREDEKREMAELFGKPVYITVNNLLANPYRRSVKNPHEAAQYIEHLKTKVLPKLKTIIETLSSPPTETFEL